MSNYPRAYLVDNSPARRQFRDRQAKPTGCMVIHTAESYPDETGPDTGAENVARFLETRSTPGSYHDLADSDSDVHCVPYAKAAYGDGTGSNEWAIHLSIATQAHRWATLPKAWREAAVKNLARCAARANRWLIANGHPACPPRRISRAQSEAGVAGFISHAQRDPARRTDPGKDFPWALFLSTYAALIGGTAPRPDQEDDMSAQAEKQINEIHTMLAHVLEVRKDVDGSPVKLFDRRDARYQNGLLSRILTTVSGMTPADVDEDAVAAIVVGALDPEKLAAAIAQHLPTYELIKKEG